MGDQFQGRVPVNKVIPFSAVDGPGNRTAVFVQGCNFNCRYCHNPETRSLCRSCGECVEKCPKQALYIENGKVLFHPELCCGCDTCIKTCRFDASPRIRYMNAQEVYQEICRQVPFIRGITVSGGECTLYPEFLEELSTLCKRMVSESSQTATGRWTFPNIQSCSRSWTVSCSISKHGVKKIILP